MCISWDSICLNKENEELDSLWCKVLVARYSKSEGK